MLFCLTALQADRAPLGSPHPGVFMTLQSMLVEATAMKALPSLMPEWPHSHGWQLVLAGIWELIWGCQLGSSTGPLHVAWASYNMATGFPE